MGSQGAKPCSDACSTTDSAVKDSYMRPGSPSHSNQKSPRLSPKGGAKSSPGLASPRLGKKAETAFAQTSAVGPASPSRRKHVAESFPPGDRLVLGRYRMFGGRKDVVGQGSSSICRRGEDLNTGKPVAIKVYKEQSGGGKLSSSTMQKYKRQISVLSELQEPFKVPADKRLWHEALAFVQPSQLFMQLLDYSKDSKGEPGPNPEDGMLYVVTELAAYSLKDFLADRRQKNKRLSREAVRDLAKRVTLAMSALHAKGFVHLDIKPENLMVFDGRVKVIDVDGCVRIGTKIAISDSSISFSPCYCAPEWARFMVEGDNTIIAVPNLDVWSIGMTICEFVTLDAVWKPQYANFLKNAKNGREAGFLFLEWLSSLGSAPLPKAIQRFDDGLGLWELLSQWLLVCDQKKRSTFAEAMSNPFLAEGGWDKYGDKQKLAEEAAPDRVEKRQRAEDDSTLAPLHKGMLWKLNSGSDGKDPANWIKRDMWIAHNHSLCYFSVKENKRLVLIDAQQLHSAEVEITLGLAKEFAIEISSKTDAEDGFTKVCLAAESMDELAQWKQNIGLAGTDMMTTFRLGAKLEEDLAAFRMAVRNRRMKVQGNTDAFEPIFKDKLWKLKTGGDGMKPEDWFERNMWVSKNGSLVYWSPKEERELVYYTQSDLAGAKIKRFPDAKACRLHVFTVHVAPADGVEFEPGQFAAESDDARDRWIKEMEAARSSEKVSAS